MFGRVEAKGVKYICIWLLGVFDGVPHPWDPVQCCPTSVSVTLSTPQYFLPPLPLYFSPSLNVAYQWNPLRGCYGLNISLPAPLTLNSCVAFGRRLGHESRAVMNDISALTKETS